MKRRGAVAVRWHAVLRIDSPLECMIRHVLVYSLTLEPLGHTIAIGRPPPQSAECSCLLLPLLRMPRESDRSPGSFEQFLGACSEPEQDRLLGREAGERWRRGEIQKEDFVNPMGDLQAPAIR